MPVGALRASAGKLFRGPSLAATNTRVRRGATGSVCGPSENGGGGTGGCARDSGSDCVLWSPGRSPDASRRTPSGARRRLDSPERTVGLASDESTPHRARLATSLIDPGSRLYPTACIMSNIGMYMAATMPPITTPITTIMIGSSTEVSASTAVSTSSS